MKVNTRERTIYNDAPTATMAETSEPSLDHHTYMRLAIAEAKKSPPKPSNFRVGALIVDASSGYVLTTSYTLELPGNTHAEQVCLIKHA